jgi:hypothetical protein
MEQSSFEKGSENSIVQINLFYKKYDGPRNSLIKNKDYSSRRGKKDL